MNAGTITVIVLTVLPALIALFAWKFPKNKAINAGDSHGVVIGKVVSSFGNSKLGKKAMSLLEEGPIATIIGYGMSFLTGFGKGLFSDNEVKSE